MAEIREVDQAGYTEFLLNTSAALFQSPAWFDLAVPEGTVMRYFKIQEGKKELAVLALPFRRGRVLNVITGLPHTPHTGHVALSRSFSDSRRISQAISDCLRGEGADSLYLAFPPEFTDFLPFKNAGLRVRIKQTYRLELLLSERELRANLRSDKQRSVKKAEKNGLHVSLSKDVSVMERLLKKTYSRRNLQNKPIDVSLKILDNFTDGFQVTVRNGQVPLSSIYVAHDADTAYYLFGGFDFEQGNHFAGPFAMWRAILEAKRKGLRTFDFEGSEIPEIEVYFAAFGAERTLYFSVEQKKFKARLLSRLT